MPFEIEGLDEAIKQMEATAEMIEKRGPAAVQAAAQAAKTELEKTVPVRTGALKGSIKIEPPKHDPVNGTYCIVFPKGKNAQGQRYETIGAVLEYGRSNMPAQPWLAPVLTGKADVISEAMRKVLFEEGSE